MEELNKSQIVLLTLLISFVTSIATGIVTVSLLDQAPAGVTQTINRVVEKTIEKVVPGQAAAIVTKEVYVPVNNEDRIIQAVDSNSKSLVRIFAQGEDKKAGVFMTLGLVVSKDGEILSDRSFFADQSTLLAVFPDGKTFPLTEAKIIGKRVVAFNVVKDDKDAYTFVPARFSDSDVLKLGQTVVSLGGGDGGNNVGVGVISSVAFDTDNSSSTAPFKFRSGIETTLNNGDKATGFYLLDLQGDIVGVHLGSDESFLNHYVPVNLIKTALTALPTASEKTVTP